MIYCLGVVGYRNIANPPNPWTWSNPLIGIKNVCPPKPYHHGETPHETLQMCLVQDNCLAAKVLELENRIKSMQAAYQKSIQNRSKRFQRYSLNRQEQSALYLCKHSF